MNKQETIKAIKELDRQRKVMQAFADGERIQVSDILSLSNPIWLYANNPVWDWEYFDYRVEPKPREFWVNVYSTYAKVHKTVEQAERWADPDILETIKVREVLDE